MRALRSPSCRALLAVALALIAGPLLASVEVLAQPADSSGGNYSVETYLGIHTVNFTQILSGGPGILPTGSTGNASRILEILRNISKGCPTLSCVSSNQSAREALRDSVRELASAGYVDPYLEGQISEVLQVPGMSYDDLMRLLSNPEIASLVSQAAAGQGNITASLGILDSLFRGGRISLNEYMAALELLKRAAISNGLEGQAAAIDAFQLDVVRQLIMSRTAEDLIAGLGGLLAAAGSQESRGTNGPRPAESGSRPATGLYIMPGPGVAGAGLLSQAAMVAVTAVAAAMSAYFLTRLVGRRAAAREAEAPVPAGIRSRIVRTYWEAVRVLSRRVPRRASETHREYLGKVRSSVGGEMAEAFERITSAYEAVRFAHEPEEGFATYVEEGLRKILERRGRRT